jgi:hypothetical protein
VQLGTLLLQVAGEGLRLGKQLQRLLQVAVQSAAAKMALLGLSVALQLDLGLLHIRSRIPQRAGHPQLPVQLQQQQQPQEAW